MTLSDITLRIKGYLPQFIVPSATALKLIDAIGTAILEFYTAVTALPDTDWDGLYRTAIYKRRGNPLPVEATENGNELEAIGRTIQQKRQLSLEDWKLFLSGKESIAEVRAALSARYAMHVARGSAAGMVADVRAISGDATADVTMLLETQSGWWIESTFPDFDNRTFMEAGRLVEIEMENDSIYPTEAIQKVINREFIPINATVVYL